jgi:hypothetical protein
MWLNSVKQQNFERKSLKSILRFGLQTIYKSVHPIATRNTPTCRKLAVSWCVRKAVKCDILFRHVSPHWTTWPLFDGDPCLTNFSFHEIWCSGFLLINVDQSQVLLKSDGRKTLYINSKVRLRYLAVYEIHTYRYTDNRKLLLILILLLADSFIFFRF